MTEKALLTKIGKLQEEIGVLSKDKENPFFKSRYFDINKLISECRPLMIKNKLVLTQPIMSGKVCSVITCTESGESIKSELEIPTITDPQKVGGCITYYRRYTLSSLLALEAEDDDGNEAAGKTSGIKTKKTDTKENLWLNPDTEEWKEAVKYLHNGGLLSKIESKYKISKDNRERLTSEAL